MHWHGIDRMQRREAGEAETQHAEQARPDRLPPRHTLVSGNRGAAGRTLAPSSPRHPHRPPRHVAMIGTKTSAPQRFSAATALAALVATACGGGGGGGPPANAAPVLVTAAFVGAGPAPTIGDTLLLTFSEEVLVGSALLSDTDVTLSAGATLGNVSVVPAKLSANTISIQLGVGVTFTPGTTTITLAPGNDAVRDTTGHLGTAGPEVVIGTSDGSAPTIGNLTVSAVDGALNGTGAAGGVMQVPANGWTLDLAYSDNSAIATALTQLSASLPVGTPAGTQAAGTNLLPFLTVIVANNTTASYRVPSNVTFPNGPVTFTCVIADVSGLGSAPATYPATVRAFTALTQPFETNVNPAQVWFLDFARDVEQFTTSAITGGVSVDVVATPNGVSDFEDILLVLGLTTASPIPNVQGGNNSNQVVIARYKAALLAELAGFYTGANVQFTLTFPGGSFGGNTSVAYNSLGFSQISIAGASNTAGVLGAAIFDPSNTAQNDNTRVDFPGQRLGIFLHTIVDSGLGPPAASLFRVTYGPFAAPVGGTPIGADPDDDDRLTGVNTDARAADIDTAIADFARFTAVVTAHECGHSVGLVVDGPMPVGLYGNDDVNFPGSSSGHIRTATLFPPGATNIMSPSLSYASTINAATDFNSLNRAYLREQVFYGN